ncbi:MAG TPA: D-aminoacyl-tRNA deacylase [Bryobacteraceae bacterium]|jgi:D-tyrosyl-tRNA(Tyr) deacylase
MRAVLQRVKYAKVEVAGAVTGEIGVGLLILLGVKKGDVAVDADWLVEKVINLRVFEDSEGKMNLSVLDVGGGLLVVSQFTLYADTRRGRRPGFDMAARPEEARALYEYFVERARVVSGLAVGTGVFQAEMAVTLLNDGPVTIICDSPEKNAA